MEPWEIGVRAIGYVGFGMLCLFGAVVAFHMLALLVWCLGHILEACGVNVFNEPPDRFKERQHKEWMERED